MSDNRDFILNIEHLNKDYEVDGSMVHVSDDINLNVKEGEFISIVGPSGCGKSTLLRIMAGLDTATSGKVVNRGIEITGISRNIGMIFQEPRLFPWLSIRENVAYCFSSREKRKEKKRIHELVEHYLELVNLSDFAEAYPNQLSGGMKQRASIARTLIENPEILLLDEPFSALDALTRLSMQKELLRIWEAEKKTMIMVTHDIDEAIFLSDRIVVLSERPSTIQKIIEVKQERPRDRSSYDFLEVRRQIMCEFFSKKENNIEYYL